MARPRKAETRDHQINLRFSAPEIVRIHQHAALSGKTVVDFGRMLLLRRPRKRKSASQRMLIEIAPRELSRWHDVGTRLNDIAHRMNSREELSPRALHGLLAELRMLIRACFPPGMLAAAYALAPAVRFHLRKVGANLVQIRNRHEQLGLACPVGLIRLLAAVRSIMSGERLPDGA